METSSLTVASAETSEGSKIKMLSTGWKLYHQNTKVSLRHVISQLEYMSFAPEHTPMTVICNYNSTIKHVLLTLSLD